MRLKPNKFIWFRFIWLCHETHVDICLDDGALINVNFKHHTSVYKTEINDRGDSLR
jgi:hypothetical protein